MKTKTITLYNYEELSKEAQERAREDYNTINEYPSLSNDMRERLSTLLDDNGIESQSQANVLYSLSYCQGDGAMFEGTFIWKGYSVTVEQSGHYYHFNSKIITWNDFVGEEQETKENKIAEDFDVIYIKICKELAQYGYEIIKYEDSEESFIDTCEANGYTFLENGKMEN